MTVVCPFFNEAGVVGANLVALRRRLAATALRWEIVLVDDGSTDRGRAEALIASEGDSRVRVLGYEPNRGRGYALRTGIAAARGDLVCTTEVDGSWDLGAVLAMVERLRRDAHLDFVVASPNLPGGGYVGVPLIRVVATRLGNRFLRWMLASGLTMHSGMTRVYRRRMIQSLPLREDRKEFHLEVIAKACALGHAVAEMPCRLTWSAARRARGTRGRHLADTRRLARQHLRWALLANPTRVALYAGGWLFAAGLAAIALKFSGALGAAAPEDVFVAFTDTTCTLGVVLVVLAGFSVQVREMLIESWREAQRQREREIDLARGEEGRRPSPVAPPAVVR